MKSSCVDARNNDQDILSSAAHDRHRIDTLFLIESDESALYAAVESIPYSLLLLRALHASSRSYGGGKHAMAAAMVRYLIFLLE
jgi:hypothetical protein